MLVEEGVAGLIIVPGLEEERMSEIKKRRSLKVEGEGANVTRSEAMMRERDISVRKSAFVSSSSLNIDAVFVASHS